MSSMVYFIVTKSLGLYINALSFLYPKKASQLAYRFFSQPRKGKLDASNLPPVLKKAAIEYICYDNHSFPVYSWKGNETTILLVHGWDSNASRWEKLLPYLQKSGSTIIGIDAPAHGLSSGIEFSVPQYAEFVQKTVQKYNPKYLIGHSIGGKTCLYYQYLYPKSSIQKIVTLGAPSEFKILLSNYIRLLRLNSKMATALENNYLATFSHEELANFSSHYFASKIDTKGLIVHDLYDDAVSIKEGKKIAATWKNATYIETKGLGHSMHNDGLYNQVCSFLFDK